MTASRTADGPRAPGPSAPDRASWRAWFQATRPATLGASAAPVLVGVGLAAAHGAFVPGLALAALTSAALLQVGANLVNDAGDFDRGADGPDRLGPARLAQRGLASPRALYRAASLAFALAALAAWPLVAHGGWPVLAVGLVALAAAAAYTVGPLPLAYAGLGDATVVLFFGPVAVGGTYFVQAHTLPPIVLVLSLAPGLLAANILLVNNLRDRHQDARAGKRTLVVRWGPSAARAQYAASVTVALALPVGLVAAHTLPPAALACLLVTPWAIREARAVARTDGAALNPRLGAAARLVLAYAALLTAGLAWGGLP